MPNLPRYEILDQQDPRWALIKLGSSQRTVGHDGCAFVSAINAANWFYGGIKFTPDMLATNAALFTDANYPRGAGLVLWERLCAALGNLRYLGAEFRENDAAIGAAIASPNKAAILNVNGGAHFVLAWHRPLWGNDFVVADPWTGSKCWAKGRWHNIVGARYLLHV